MTFAACLFWSDQAVNYKHKKIVFYLEISKSIPEMALEILCYYYGLLCYDDGVQKGSQSLLKKGQFFKKKLKDGSKFKKIA